MDYNTLVKEVEEKTNQLAEGLGLKFSELSAKGFSDMDIKKIETHKKAGHVKFEDGKFKATELAAAIALDKFIEYTDDEAEFIIEEEMNTRSSTDFVDSYHFVKPFDEDVWTCFYTKTTYGLQGPNEFIISEVGPEKKTDELESLLRYVQAYDKRFSENKAFHILNQYQFQHGEMSDFTQR